MARRRLPEPTPDPTSYTLDHSRYDEDRDFYLLEMGKDEADYLRGLQEPTDVGRLELFTVERKIGPGSRRGGGLGGRLGITIDDRNVVKIDRMMSITSRRTKEKIDITLNDDKLKLKHPIEFAEIRKTSPTTSELRWIGTTKTDKIVLRGKKISPFLQKKPLSMIQVGNIEEEDEDDGIINIQEVLGKKEGMTDRHVKSTDEKVLTRFLNFMDGKEATFEEIYEGIQCTQDELKRVLSTHAEKVPETKRYRVKIG